MRHTWASFMQGRGAPVAEGSFRHLAGSSLAESGAEFSAPKQNGDGGGSDSEDRLEGCLKVSEFAGDRWCWQVIAAGTRLRDTRDGSAPPAALLLPLRKFWALEGETVASEIQAPALAVRELVRSRISRTHRN